MMTEFEDRSREEQQLFLRYLERAKAQDSAGSPPTPPEASRFWRLIGGIWLTYVRWRYSDGK